MEKVLKKVDKSRPRRDSLVENVGGLCVDGWSVYLVWDEINHSGVIPAFLISHSQPDVCTQGDPLTEAELLAVCHGSSVHYDPVKERGLILQKTGQTERAEDIDIHQTHGESPTQTISLTRHLPPLGPSESDGPPDADKPLTTCPESIDGSKVRAIEVGTSIFSVHDTEKRDSPKQDQQENPSAGSSKGSPKLHNFLHQRPPSELISAHLTEHLPLREKKVLRKARPRDMSSCGPSRGRSDSRISAPRFSKGSNASRSAQRSKLSVTLVKLWKSVKGL
jgi:mitogen-activated protein kinase kinase kinase